MQYRCALSSDRKMIAVCVRVTFPLLHAVRDVIATLFNERGRVVSSSCHAVPRGRSVDLEWMRKLEIQDVRRIRKEIAKLLKLAVRAIRMFE